VSLTIESDAHASLIGTESLTLESPGLVTSNPAPTPGQYRLDQAICRRARWNRRGLGKAGLFEPDRARARSPQGRQGRPGWLKRPPTLPGRGPGPFVPRGEQDLESEG
jgi:hypothetical protein